MSEVGQLGEQETAALSSILSAGEPITEETALAQPPPPAEKVSVAAPAVVPTPANPAGSLGKPAEETDALELNDAQKDALRLWKEEHGGSWKKDLTAAWETGEYGDVDENLRIALEQVKTLVNVDTTSPGARKTKLQAEAVTRRGQGVGGPRQGTGGTDTCRCPECGAQVAHQRGKPCRSTKCPKCGTPMVGENVEETPDEELEDLTREVAELTQEHEPEGEVVHARVGDQTVTGRVVYRHEGSIDLVDEEGELHTVPEDSLVQTLEDDVSDFTDIAIDQGVDKAIAAMTK